MDKVRLLEKQSILFLRILNAEKYPNNEMIKNFFELFLKCSLSDIRGCQKVIQLFDAISPDALAYKNKYLRYYWGILYKLMGYHIESEGRKMYNSPKEPEPYIPQKYTSLSYETYHKRERDKEPVGKPEGYWGYNGLGIPYTHEPSIFADVYDKDGYQIR